MTGEELVSAQIQSGGCSFTIEQRNATSYTMVVDGHDERFGAAVVWVNNFGQPGWQIRLTPPRKWALIGRWRQKVSIVPGASLQLTCEDAADLLAVLIADMRFLDPTVSGDPVEERASRVVRGKLHELRQLVQRQEEQIASMRPPQLRRDAVGVVRSNTAVTLPGGVQHELGCDVAVQFRTVAGVVHAELSGGDLVLSTERVWVQVLPVSGHCVKVLPVADLDVVPTRSSSVDRQRQ